MIFRQLDDNGDWTFGSGKNNFTTRNQAIGLNIATRLRSWVNDCFFAQKSGVDYTNLFGSKSQQQLLESSQQRIISQSYGITAILSFSAIYNNRNQKVVCNIATIFSPNFQLAISLGFPAT